MPQEEGVSSKQKKKKKESPVHGKLAAEKVISTTSREVERLG